MKTKKLIVGIGLALLGSFAAHSQGLENVTVEKYYVTNAADATQADADIDQYNIDNGTSLPHGALPAGSVTYRFYADMLPGYKVLSVYADGTKSQSLIFTTTTSFYNNPLGTESPVPGTSKAAIKNNLLALDTYYSLGGVATGNYGILKTEDNGAANNITVAGNPNGVLLNNDPSAGIPLTTQDGMIAGAGIVSPATSGFTAAHSDVFNNGTVITNSFVLSDGSWFNGTGGNGPIAGTNRVLIAQITTDGVLHYELNILLKSPGGAGETYATNPAAGDQTAPGLSGTLGASNIPPTVSITSPADGASFITGSNVAIAANAADADGSVASVEFFVDAVSVGIDNTAPYTANYTAVAGSHALTAKATDDLGAQTTSSVVNITVASNPPPTVSITSPSNGANFVTGDVVAIAANAADNGSVTQVEFFVDAVLLSIDNTAPYTANYNAVLGSHSLTARATDDMGLQTTSSVVTINVLNNTPPTVSITSPSNGSSFTHPVIIPISANAADADGSVTQVEFFVNAASIGVDNTAPYSFNWSSVIGNAVLTAKATDDRGAITTSAPVSIVVEDPNALPYRISAVTNTCLEDTFCMPIMAFDTVANVIGYDVILHYDITKVQPTGFVSLSGDLINAAHVSYAVNTANPGHMIITEFLNGSSTAGEYFTGTGQLFCVEFVKTGGFQATDTAFFSADLEESYYTHVVTSLVQDGNYNTYMDSLFHANLIFWDAPYVPGNIPIQYNSALPNNYLITNIFGTDLSCGNKSVVPVQPDTLGAFTHSIWDGKSVQIERDILATTDVQPVVNGADAVLAIQVATSVTSFTPSVYQIVAADVNMDGLVRAGDVSQINQRTVLVLPEFKQMWNAGNGAPSKDWLFVNPTLLASAAYQISATYPGNDLSGYSKDKVPAVPFCLPVPVTSYDTCPLIGTATYTGIMLGDVNGNYENIPADGLIKKVISNGTVVFDMSKAVITNGYLDVPVSISSSKEAVTALDFALQFNESKLAFNSIVVNTTAEMQTLSHYNADDKTLRFTSYAMQNYEKNKSLVSVRFAVLGESVNTSDISSVRAYLNGEFAEAAKEGSASTLGNNSVNVYPNPASGTLFIEASEQSNVKLFDMSGKVVMETRINANETQTINVTGFASGVYMMKIYNDTSVSTQKVVIK